MSEQVLDALVDICGPDYARAARSVDAVAGRRVDYVAVPATTRAVADTLRLATERGLTVMTRGSGSKIDWGTPPRGVNLLIDTGRLAGMWDHDVAAATAEVGTGTPVRALQAALALRGQRLPVDPPSRTATVGGMLALNESGPLRHRFGPPAEHVARVSYVDHAGQAADSDGENGRPGIADITGVLTSAVVHLQPVPAARRWIAVAVPSPLHLPALIEAAAEADPSAIELDLPGAPAGMLAALIEGDEPDTTARASRLAQAWGPDATITTIAPPWWGTFPFDRRDVGVRLSAPPADLPSALYALGDAAGGPVPIRGSAGSGTVHAALPGSLPPSRLTGIMQTLEHVLMARSGRAVIVSAPTDLIGQIETAGRRDLF